MKRCLEFHRSLHHRTGLDQLGPKQGSWSSPPLLNIGLLCRVGLGSSGPKRVDAPLALARRVGTPFSDWVGDIEDWDSAFAGTYNAIKHDPVFSPDPYAVHYLAQSGYLLLLSAILNRISGTKDPSRSLFGSRRTYGLGDSVRGVLADPSVQIKRREPSRRRKRNRSG